MLDNYSKEEVNKALDRLAADMKQEGHIARQTALIFAAREALARQGSDWQEAERSSANQTMKLDTSSKNEE